MKMAKASEADLNMAFELVQALDNMLDKWNRTMPDIEQNDDAEEQEPFDPHDGENCAEAIRRVEEIYKKGSLFRVIGNITTLLDPINECVDPDADTLEHHPDLEKFHDLLLWTLYHHQGGSSHIGQPIRKALGIGRYDHLTPEQLARAKAAGCQNEELHE